MPVTAQELNVKDKTKSGGDTTRSTTNRMSFSLPSANIPKNKLREFFFGNRLFNTNWVTAPASVKSFDGLGPLFNRVSCSGCHLRDGRGRPPENKGAPMQSMLLRLSIPGRNKHGGPNPVPGYGGQLNDRAISAVTPEGQVVISYTEIRGEFEDGTVYSLRQPKYSFKNLGYGPMPKDLLISPRVAPAVFGLGLLEAIPESSIFDRADPNDKNSDGISGKVNMVWDQEAGNLRLGHFGWKANQPSLKQQNAGAFLGDIGITSSLFIDQNCAEEQKQCQQEITGGRPEISTAFLKKLEFYTQSLAVPARRNINDPEVRRGEEIFSKANCSNCHLPNLTTGKYKNPMLADQNIQPFTDLLLHDMGDDLADGRPDFDATGNEWRTPPLWGIGLQKTVNGHTLFLHDGRARNLSEAILWHGGEGEKSSSQYLKMSASDRSALLKFLNSL